MKLDKYIFIQAEIYTDTPDGGSTSTFSEFWKGWAKVVEKNYNTVMESGQFVGSKASEFTIRKNSITDGINTAMRVVYRSREYLIRDVIEIDPYYLKMIATEKERNGS